MVDHGESLGVVSGAYFVGRIKLLEWINDLTKLNYAKIEETASGVFACHVFDALYPGKIRIERVRFDAKHSYDYVHNYKLLQECFNRLKMKRQIDIQKLIRGKYQDNLEFMQWLKAYYDAHASEEALNYDGLARRQQIKVQRGSAAGPSASVTTPRSAAPILGVARVSPTRPKPGRPTTTSSTTTSGAPPTRARAPSAASAVQLRQLREENATLRKDIVALEEQVQTVESEREFYFRKLRQVEIVVQAVESELAVEGVDELKPLRHALEDVRHALYSEDDVEDAPIVEDGPPMDGEEAHYPEDAELANDPEYVASPAR